MGPSQMTLENVPPAVFGRKQAKLPRKSAGLENWLGVRDDFRNWMIAKGAPNRAAAARAAYMMEYSRGPKEGFL